MSKYRAPSDMQVNEALRRTLTPELRRAFFEGLVNPLWLEPLRAADCFASPPEPLQAENGQFYDPHWPELIYLVRVAPEDPRAVVDILLTFVESKNSWVRRAVFAVGASIPASEAARLKPLLKAWIGTGFGWRTDPSDMTGFVMNLLQGGEYKTGTWLANALFRPAESAESGSPRLALNEYAYVEALPQVAKALGPKGLPQVLGWLEAYERATGRVGADRDVTFLSRESIAESSELHGHESVEQALIDAARDLAIEAMATEREHATTALSKTPMVLAQKILLHALAENLRATEAPTPDELSSFAAVLFDEEFRDDMFRIEFADLARAIGSHSKAALEPLTEYLSAGPDVNIETLRARVRRSDDDSPEQIEEWTQGAIERWKHRRLASIGESLLPVEMAAMLADLDAKRGPIENALAPSFIVTSWSGPNSALGQDEMLALGPNRLIDYLSTWHSTADGWGPEPTHEGQARELTAISTTNPKIVAGETTLVSKLRPIYIRALLNGWDGALRAEIELDWDQVHEVITDVLHHDDASEFAPEGDEFDDNHDYRQAKWAAVKLLAELAKQRERVKLPLEMRARFAHLLITDADDAVAWDEYNIERPDDMDPLTLSINWQWPIRVRGLVNLVGHGMDTSWYQAARNAIEVEMERDDKRGALSAVLGESIGRLLNTDPEWFLGRVPALFGDQGTFDRNQQIALTTTLALYNYHAKFYDLLTPSLLAAVKLGSGIVAGWKGEGPPLQRIGEWVVSALMFGHKTIDDPVAASFFSDVDPQTRGKAIGHVAWSLMHASEIDEETRSGFAAVWDARLEHVRHHPEDKAELDEFYWVARSGKYGSAWWLPRFIEALSLDPNLAGGRFMVGKNIATAADEDPRRAFDLTKALIEQRGNSAMPTYDLTHNALPMVLGRAIGSGDETLRRQAVELMNLLGEQGNRDLQRQVDAVLSGEVTQDDVSE